MTREPIIELRNATKHWWAGNNKIPILKNVTLQLFKGESVAIMGPSGAGKSTLMHVLALLTPIDDGEIRFNNRVLNDAGKRVNIEILRKISFIFQDAKLIPNLSVFDNVCVPLIHRGVSKKQRQLAVCEVLEKVSLADRIDHLPNQLSGGEIMRVAIARAIITQPEVIFADEPTGSLDSKMGEVVAKLLYSLVSENTALIVVTHQQKLADYADYILTMEDGVLT